MRVSAICLLVIAGALHAGWNLVVKRVPERLAFLWLALLVGSLAFLPVLVVSLPRGGRVWALAVASALVEVAYFIGLARAYASTDFSLLYPMARGAAPALLALWAVLFLGELPTRAGAFGILVIAAGLAVIGGSAFRARQPARPSARHVALALGIALLISVYSALDGAAVRLTAPAGYMESMFLLTTLALAPWMLSASRRPVLKAVWRRHRLHVAAVGIIMVGTYGLVLAAYASSPVSYAGAVREVSIVFGALAGWLWLREPFGAVRSAGALVVCAGILVVAARG